MRVFEDKEKGFCGWKEGEARLESAKSGGLQLVTSLNRCFPAENGHRNSVGTA